LEDLTPDDSKPIDTPAQAAKKNTYSKERYQRQKEQGFSPEYLARRRAINKEYYKRTRAAGGTHEQQHRDYMREYSRKHRELKRETVPAKENGGRLDTRLSTS
jgi:hypothetical protein